MPVLRHDDTAYTLASNLGATGSAVAIRGGLYNFTVEGTVGTTTVSLQMQTVNGSWVDVIAFGVIVKSTTLPYCFTGIELPECNVRMACTGGSGESALYSYLVGLG